MIRSLVLTATVLSAALSITANAGDLAWSEMNDVPVASSDIGVCVIPQLSKVPGISLEPIEALNEVLITVSWPQGVKAGGTVFIDANRNIARIWFSYSGFESSAQKSAVRPKLKELSDIIKSTCS